MEQACTQEDQYLLARHAFLCIDAGNTILLDLRADKYIGIAAFQSAQLSSLVKGWPAVSGNVSPVVDPPKSTESLVRSFLERGLITANPHAGKEATPVMCDAPTGEVGADSWCGDTSIRLSDWAHCLSSILVASLWLRLRGIEGTIRYVQARNRRKQATAHPTRDLLAQSIFVFAKLRPFFLTSRDKCLLESLALIEFLSRKGIYPSWVFAVHSNPFGAHCWLQSGLLVLNDTLDNVQEFTPIMVV